MFYILSYGFIFHGCRIAFNKRESCFSLGMFYHLSVLPCARINLGVLGCHILLQHVILLWRYHVFHPFLRIMGEIAVFLFFMHPSIIFWFIK